MNCAVRTRTGPGSPAFKNDDFGFATACGQAENTWNLPESTMSSLTLTVVLDQATSYQFSVRIRKNACCDFSPCAEAGAMAPTVAITAAAPMAASLTRFLMNKPPSFFLFAANATHALSTHAPSTSPQLVFPSPCF